MPKYLLQVGYTSEGWAALIKAPQDRAEAVRGAIEKMGGKIDSFHLAFGKYDVIAIVDMPDNVTAAAFAMSVAAGGACNAVRTTPLLSTADGVKAMKKAGASQYRPATVAAPKATARSNGRAKVPARAR